MLVHKTLGYEFDIILDIRLKLSGFHLENEILIAIKQLIFILSLSLNDLQHIPTIFST